MSKIIALGQSVPKKTNSSDTYVSYRSNPTFQENLEILSKHNQSKINYSIKEVSAIINLSYDFIRERIKSGAIASIKFGDRFMIHVNEVARILTEGI